VVKSSLDNYFGLFDRIGMKASYSGEEAVEGVLAFKAKRSRVGCIRIYRPTAGCSMSH
jgi:hypothetical protein